LTYVELDYPSQEAARDATVLLDEMGITGEWHLRKGRADNWRLSIASEVDVRDEDIARLGGKPVEDQGGPDAADEEE
jgi:hypothetical protein